MKLFHLFIGALLFLATLAFVQSLPCDDPEEGPKEEVTTAPSTPPPSCENDSDEKEKDPIPGLGHVKEHIKKGLALGHEHINKHKDILPVESVVPKGLALGNKHLSGICL